MKRSGMTETEMNEPARPNTLESHGICNMLLSRPPQPDDARTTIRTIYSVPDPSDVHEDPVVLHPHELLHRQEMVGLLRVGDRDHDEVGVLEHLL